MKDNPFGKKSDLQKEKEEADKNRSTRDFYRTRREKQRAEVSKVNRQKKETLVRATEKLVNYMKSPEMIALSKEKSIFYKQFRNKGNPDDEDLPPHKELKKKEDNKIEEEKKRELELINKRIADAINAGPDIDEDNGPDFLPEDQHEPPEDFGLIPPEEEKKFLYVRMASFAQTNFFDPELHDLSNLPDIRFFWGPHPLHNQEFINGIRIDGQSIHYIARVRDLEDEEIRAIVDETDSYPVFAFKVRLIGNNYDALQPFYPEISSDMILNAINVAMQYHNPDDLCFNVVAIKRWSFQLDAEDSLAQAIPVNIAIGNFPTYGNTRNFDSRIRRFSNENMLRNFYDPGAYNLGETGANHLIPNCSKTEIRADYDRFSRAWAQLSERHFEVLNRFHPQNIGLENNSNIIRLGLDDQNFPLNEDQLAPPLSLLNFENPNLVMGRFYVYTTPDITDIQYEFGETSQ